MKLKRDREAECFICGHYHHYEAGEVCGVCGHAPPGAPGAQCAAAPSPFPSEIIQDSLFLGSYDNASRSELLKHMGIRHILNAVPTCQNLYRNSFTYHTASAMPNPKHVPLDECVAVLAEALRQPESKVLVHCMSGTSRSPSIVIAYLMQQNRWRLTQSFQWVRERRPCINLQPEAAEQLRDFEHRLFGDEALPAEPALAASAAPCMPPPGPFCMPVPGAPAAAPQATAAAAMPTFTFAPPPPQNAAPASSAQPQGFTPPPAPGGGMPTFSFSFGAGAAPPNGQPFVFGAPQQQQPPPPPQLNGNGSQMDE